MTEINFNDFKNEILTLRQNVWEQTDPSLMKQFYLNGFYDEHDKKAFHCGIFDDNKILIASARLTQHFSFDTLPAHDLLTDISQLNIEFPIGSLNRLSVDLKFQGKGYSELFDKIRIEKAIEIGCKSICGITYGQRSNKFLADGFSVFHSQSLLKLFVTSKEDAKKFPLAFYYKAI